MATESEKKDKFDEIIKDMVNFDMTTDKNNTEKKALILTHIKTLFGMKDMLVDEVLGDWLKLFKQVAEDRKIMPTTTDEVGTDEDKEDQSTEEEMVEPEDQENPEHEATETPEEEQTERDTGIEDESEVKAESVRKTRGQILMERASGLLDD